MLADLFSFFIEMYLDSDAKKAIKLTEKGEQIRQHLLAIQQLIES
jgi:hypothetical protein